MTEARQTAKQPSASFFDFFDRCDARCSEHAGEAAEAALKLCHGFAGLVIRRFQSAVDRRENQILAAFSEPVSSCLPDCRAYRRGNRLLPYLFTSLPHCG